MSIVVKLRLTLGSYYLKYFPIKFQDKMLKIVEVIKKNVHCFFVTPLNIEFNMFFSRISGKRNRISGATLVNTLLICLSTVYVLYLWATLLY